MKEEFKNPYEHKLVRNYCKCEPTIASASLLWDSRSASSSLTYPQRA